MTAPGRPSGVLLVDLARRTGGAETRVVATARGLADRGVPVSVACLEGSPLASALEHAGVRAEAVARRKWDPRLVAELGRVMRARPGWIVDAHNAQSQLAVRLADRGRAPTGARIATVHSEYGHSEGRLWGFSWHEAVLRCVIRSRWKLVAVSPAVRRNLQGLGAADDVAVVWSGIDGAGVARDRAEVRRELGIGSDEFVVAAVGRMVPVKNFDMAIRAVALLHRSLPTARLLVVGDGPERERLEQLALRQPGPADLVRFLGHRDDVADLLVACDALVITSTTEGLPYVLLEAAASRTPVVSTAVGAIPDVFGGGAVALLPWGVQSDLAGPAILARELSSLALQPDRRDRMVTRAARVQQRRLSLESMLTATIDSYGLGAEAVSPRAEVAR
ncbi:glycosyltransferase family 4 protein [Humibacillus xanthopallidus]|uniref:glycosyltransferase family 4 protein n=1 Tax=Humibacillus xanthopallidus TaxID=412689 RepID=UPI00384FD844